MTDETKKDGVDDQPQAKPEVETAAEATAEDLAGAAKFAAEANGEPVEQPSELELATAERDALKDKYLRLAAEMDNLRRRTARDVRDAKAYSVSNFARDMLAVSDNLRRALDAIPEEALAAGEQGLKALSEGVEMTERSMLSALEKHGVKKLSPTGEKFDPNFHQAMFEVPNPEVPNNTVVEVVQEGFVIGDRVLRPAMVGVAKGGPKQPATPPETESQDAEQ
ncbi:MAG: nucleotide exchange factor GrpE [Pseudomonadota bacterium]